MNNEFFWDRMPFFRLLLPFLGGVIFQIYLQSDIPFIGPILFSLFVLIILTSSIKKIAISYRFRAIFGMLLSIFLFVSGIFLVTLKTESRDHTQFNKINDKEGYYLLRLNTPYLEKDRSLKVVMEVRAVKKGEKWITSTGKAMIYIQKDSLAEMLHYGDEILVKTNFVEIPPPQNPSEFNYKQFLYFHNVYQQAYVRAGEWKNTGVNSGNWILDFSYSLRDRLLEVMREAGLKGDEYAVASALVLGYTDKLDQDVIAAYASTGALHVLSVSGLHVGIIYFVFNLFFSFLDKRKKGNIIKTFLLLFIVWFYATLTGLSPSVLRSAAMFTFIIIAKGFKFNTDIFNTLAVSCFVLLMYDPYLIMEVGFQLSFLAVFGIVFLQPKLYELWQPKTKVMDWIWALTTVSLAAQLATFPLGLLYFHQFPNLFLFSNLVVIPISTVVLYLGILLFFVSKIIFVGAFVGKLLYWSVYLLNGSVEFMEKLPYAIIQGISISIFETWLLYLMIVFLTAFFFNRNRKYILYCLTCIAAILMIQLQQDHVELRQRKFIVYNAPRSTAIDLINGKQNIFIADPAFINNKSRMLFHVKHNWWDLGLKEQKLIAREGGMNYKDKVVMAKNNFIQFGDERIVIVDSSFSFANAPGEKLKVDRLLISQGPKLKIKKLLSYFEPAKIIFDSSNPKWKVKRWKAECDEMSVPYYDVASNGAFVEEINAQ